MSQITIDLITPDEMTLTDTEIPQDYSVSQIIDELVDNLNLQRFDAESGKPVDWFLKWENQNIRLDPKQTLHEAGVGQGEKLRLQSSIPMTASPTTASLPVESSTGDDSIAVFLKVLDLNKSAKETFRVDQKVQDVIGTIVKANALPNRDPEMETPIFYSLRSKALGRVLQGTETFKSAGIPRLDTLTLLRDDIAGAVWL